MLQTIVYWMTELSYWLIDMRECGLPLEIIGCEG